MSNRNRRRGAAPLAQHYPTDVLAVAGVTNLRQVRAGRRRLTAKQRRAIRMFARDRVAA